MSTVTETLPQQLARHQQAGNPHPRDTVFHTQQWVTCVRSSMETVWLCQTSGADPAGLSWTDSRRAPKKSRSPGREQDHITKYAGSGEQGITCKSWQPAQISFSLESNPTHSYAFGEGTKSPQGAGLGEVYIWRWWGWMQCTQEGGGPGCKARAGTRTGRKDSLQQLGADKRK